MLSTTTSTSTSAVHLLADHGGICEKGELNFEMSGNGHTQGLHALRQVGVDALVADAKASGRFITGKDLPNNANRAAAIQPHLRQHREHRLRHEPATFRW